MRHNGALWQTRDATLLNYVLIDPSIVHPLGPLHDLGFNASKRL